VPDSCGKAKADARNAAIASIVYILLDSLPQLAILAFLGGGTVALGVVLAINLVAAWALIIAFATWWLYFADRQRCAEGIDS
jgi:hypothetical protein